MEGRTQARQPLPHDTKAITQLQQLLHQHSPHGNNRSKNTWKMKKGPLELHVPATQHYQRAMILLQSFLLLLLQGLPSPQWPPTEHPVHFLSQRQVQAKVRVHHPLLLLLMLQE